MTSFFGATAIALSLAPLLAGCTSSAGDPVQPLPGSGGTFDATCPQGDTGISPGDLLKGYSFDGYVDPSKGTGEKFHKTISFCDFYNPDGNGTYGSGTAFKEGDPKPKALLITVAGLWCQPCREEAAKILPGEYAMYHPDGLEIVSVIADTTTPGESANFPELDVWVTGYDVEYVAVVDPPRTFTKLFNAGQFPANVLVDPRTMRVKDNIVGKPDQGFFQEVEDLLSQ